MNHTTRTQAARTAIILAGGDGTRLREPTWQIAGFNLPKQFCTAIGNTTLLEQTRKRTSLAVEPDNTPMSGRIGEIGSPLIFLRLIRTEAPAGKLHVLAVRSRTRRTSLR